MSIIDYTYFTGKLNLPQTGNTIGQTLINQFINQYEPEYFKKALGYDLWKAFTDALNVLGPEEITNGGFDGDATGWTLGSGWTYADDKVTHAGSQTEALHQAGMLNPAKTYRVSFNISGTVGAVNVYFGGTPVKLFNAGDGNVTFDSIWFNNDSKIEFHPSAAFNGSIDNVSVKEIVIEQRWVDLLQGKDFEYAGRNDHWNGFQPTDKLTPIANYVYYKYMEEKAIDNTLVGTATGAVDNNTRVNPVPKMIDAWNSMVEMDKTLWYFLKANQDTYPEWISNPSWDRWYFSWDSWYDSWPCRNAEVFHFKNSLDL